MKASQPDQIIRDISLIARYSRHNEAQDYRFRTFLKVECDLSNKKLDSIVQETTDEVWRQIDCTTCANCCKTLQIIVDDADIRRLSARLGMSFPSFSKKYVLVAEDKTKYFASTPCVFLGADNRCTVYEDRPQACRDFPYLHSDGFRNRTFMMIDNCNTCPIVFNVWQRLKSRLWHRRR
jgi:Fe-S-cluster containining protein